MTLEEAINGSNRLWRSFNFIRPDSPIIIWEECEGAYNFGFSPPMEARNVFQIGNDGRLQSYRDE